MSKSKQPFQSGQLVTFAHGIRVEPFLSDDVFKVDALSRGGTSRKPLWRMRVILANRPAAIGSGWVDATDMVAFVPEVQS